jgi:hypothetical protein
LEVDRNLPEASYTKLVFITRGNGKVKPSGGTLVVQFEMMGLCQGSGFSPADTKPTRALAPERATYQKAALGVIESSEFVGTPKGDALTRISQTVPLPVRD